MKTLLIIPALNEQDSIVSVVRHIQAVFPSGDILVIDDGSTDETSPRALSLGVKVLNLPFNLGIGGAVQAGYQHALAYGYDVAVQFDADGQHDAHFLEPLLKPLRAHECDMVIGSRFLPPNLDYRASALRRIGIIFFANLISFLIGQKVTDPTSGFRAVNKKLIRIFSEDYPIDFPEPESIVEASRARARVREIPVVMHARLKGLSSIRYLKTLYYMIKVTCAIILRKFKVQKEISHDHH